MNASLLALAAIALWGSLAPLGVSLGHVPPFLLTGVGLVIGSVIGLLLSRGRVSAWKVPAATLALGVYGLFGFHFLLFIALRHAPPVQANLVNYLWPLGIVLMAPLFLPGMRLRALHAADAAPPRPDEIARVLADPDRLPGLCLRLHPAAGVIRSPFAVMSLWAAHHGVGRLDDIDPFRPESALVVRPALDVEVVGLPPGGDRFVLALADGLALGEAADAAGADPAFDLAATLALLIRHGALGALHHPDRS